MQENKLFLKIKKAVKQIVCIVSENGCKSMERKIQNTVWKKN